MVTKEVVREETEKVNEDDFDSKKEKINKRNLERDWYQFIEETYGCLAEDIIERGDQGKFEKREEIV